MLLTMISNSYNLSELEIATGFSIRTIRYYLKEIVGTSQGTAGPKAAYPKSVSDKLKFVALLKEKVPYLKLAELKRILDTMIEEDISRIADGEEPLEVADIRSADGIRDFEMRTRSPGKRQKIVKVVFDGHAAKQSTDRPTGKTRVERKTEQTDDWTTITVADGVEIRVNRAMLSKKQQEQIRAAGKLITSMLD